jgi:hypothetical protein
MKKNNIGIALVASLTLGLAPFVPEPHLFGKIRWVLGGGEGMQAMDWFDLIMHGSPFIWLLFEISKWARMKYKTSAIKKG